MKNLVKSILKVLTLVGFPLTFLAALWLKIIRKVGPNPIDEAIFMNLGVLPVVDHYYHPLINPKKHLTKSLRADRSLKGIDFNEDKQLELLSKFNYNDELLSFPLEKSANIEFYYNNGSFCSGDAEYLYNVVRFFKPKRIIEIGCGASTLMIKNAIKKNIYDDPDYTCNHICIEPYEQPWLEKIGIEVIRKKVEELDVSFFETLGANDMLFIDSSHMIRPQGDVLFEFLEILPILKSGVLVHVHDIFFPKDYLDEWVLKDHLFWNEQYLLEAFLTFNNKFDIIGALNYLTHHHREELSVKCPVFANQPGREPGSFWMVKK
jgi:predicted O-methyltransferase YrrM